MNAIFFVLRTGCRWNALNAIGICSSSTAHRRFQQWEQAGVFLALWMHGLDWSWLSMDGAMTKAPLGGGKTGPNPTDRAKLGAKRSLLVEANGVPIGLAVAGANVNDFKLARDTLESIPVHRPRPHRGRTQNLCLDKGYLIWRSSCQSEIDTAGIIETAERYALPSLRLHRPPDLPAESLSSDVGVHTNDGDSTPSAD